MLQVFLSTQNREYQNSQPWTWIPYLAGRMLQVFLSTQCREYQNTQPWTWIPYLAGRMLQVFLSTQNIEYQNTNRGHGYHIWQEECCRYSCQHRIESIRIHSHGHGYHIWQEECCRCSCQHRIERSEYTAVDMDTIFGRKNAAGVPVNTE